MCRDTKRKKIYFDVSSSLKSMLWRRNTQKFTITWMLDKKIWSKDLKTGGKLLKHFREKPLTPTTVDLKSIRFVTTSALPANLWSFWDWRNFWMRVNWKTDFCDLQLFFSVNKNVKAIKILWNSMTVFFVSWDELDHFIARRWKVTICPSRWYIFVFISG